MSFNPKAVSVTDTPENYEALVYQNGEWVAASNPGVDPSQFGNWVLHEKLEFDNETLSHDVSGNFDQYDKVLVEITLTDLTKTDNVNFRFNNDSGNNYVRLYQYGGTAHGGGITASTDEINIAHSGSGYSKTEIVPKSGIRRKILTINGHVSSANSHVREEYHEWTNTVDEITAINFYSSGSVSGEIKVYVWQELKPVELHSYELIKEFNLDNETVDYTFDVTPDDDIVIQADVITQTAGTNLFFRPNGSTSGYTTRSLYGYSSNASSQEHNLAGMMVAACSSVGRTENVTFGFRNVKSGGARCAQAHLGYVDGSDRRTYMFSHFWSDTASDITSAQLITTALLFGTIRVYRRVKTHLISNNPGLLKDMWQKSIDTDTIEIAPGDIEIAGTICNNTAPKQVTLSGNLRSGETEAADTYYYLYAIRGDGRTLSFKFSSTAPTMDRFGNTVSSFEDCDSDGAWYHPNEGITWRYIGQVYNDSSSNILAFDKCKPGYWESVWTAFTGSTDTNHALGKEIWSGDVVFSKDNPPTNTYKFDGFYYVDSGGSTYGSSVEQRDNALTDARLRLGSAGTFHDGSSFQTSGYYKLILKG